MLFTSMLFWQLMPWTLTLQSPWPDQTTCAAIQRHTEKRACLLQVKSRRLKQLHWDKIKTPQQGTVWAKDQPQVNLNLTELENLFQVNLPSCQQHIARVHVKRLTSPLPIDS